MISWRLKQTKIPVGACTASTSLCPFGQNSDATRLAMWDGQSKQIVPPYDGTPPIIYSGTEGAVATLSRDNRFSDISGDVYRIIKDQYNHLIVIVNPTEKKIQSFMFNTYMNASEVYGWVQVDVAGNRVVKGDPVIVTKYSTGQDGRYSEHNFNIGQNPKTVYGPFFDLTSQDAVVISEDFAKSYRTPLVEVLRLIISPNDYILPGPSGRGIPKVGDQLTGNEVLLLRKMSAKYRFIDKSSKTRKLSDIQVLSKLQNPRVVGLTYIGNSDTSNEMSRSLENFWVEVRSTFEHHPDYTLIGDSGYYLELSKYFTGYGNVKFSSSMSVYDHAFLELVLSSDIYPTPGSKFTGRYGNKGVTSMVIPNVEFSETPTVKYVVPNSAMPVDEFGNRADVVQFPMSVMNRNIIGAQFELELNSLSMHILRMLSSLGAQDRVRLLSDYYSQLPGNEAVAAAISESEYGDEIIRNALSEQIIPIRAVPYSGIDGYGLMRLYDRYNYVPPKLHVPVMEHGATSIHQVRRMTEVVRPIPMGQQYMLLLRHEPEYGMTVRGGNGPYSLYGPLRKDQSRPLVGATRVGEFELKNILIGGRSEYLVGMNGSAINRQRIRQELLNNDDGLSHIPLEELLTADREALTMYKQLAFGCGGIEIVSD